MHSVNYNNYHQNDTLKHFERNRDSNPVVRKQRVITRITLFRTRTYSSMNLQETITLLYTCEVSKNNASSSVRGAKYPGETHNVDSDGAASGGGGGGGGG